MATARMPDEFYDILAHHLPPEQPVGPQGGRPRVGHRSVMPVIWFVLATGSRREDVPAELGGSGRTAHRRLRAREEAGVWDRLHADLLGLLKRAGKLDLGTVVVDAVTVRAFGGGEATGPSPVDRRWPGTKHTLMVDRSGVPPAIRTCWKPFAANTRCCSMTWMSGGGGVGRPSKPGTWGVAGSRPWLRPRACPIARSARA